ncbi:MAG: hypothetical protein JST16_02785 [Bdellovibrionales bacterium]|nr:hypothetical protein [Bdellovibrionales bacterium]
MSESKVKSIGRRRSLEGQIDDVIAIVAALYRPVREVALGIWSGRMPLYVFAVAIVCLVMCGAGLDFSLMGDANLEWLARLSRKFLTLYLTGVAALPFFIWGAVEIRKRKTLDEALSSAFFESKLVTSKGKVPSLVELQEQGDMTTRLRLKLNGLSAFDVERSRKDLASRLGIHVISMKNHQTKGLMDIVFSTFEIPDLLQFGDVPPKSTHGLCEFPIGIAQNGQMLFSSFRQTPHFLVGGSSQHGKSSFIRQALTYLYQNNRGAIEFQIIDMKQNAEGIVFDDVTDFRLAKDAKDAHKLLLEAVEELKDRLAYLTANRKENIDALNLVPQEKRTTHPELSLHKIIPRIIISIDEATELLVPSPLADRTLTEEMRGFISTIAAMGRAAGIHLMIGTQRPDVNTLDGATKTNIEGRLCYYMSDTTSSTIVLDSGKAAALDPSKRGRAIYRMGAEYIEVQTPYLSREECDKFFLGLKKKPFGMSV